MGTRGWILLLAALVLVTAGCIGAEETTGDESEGDETIEPTDTNPSPPEEDGAASTTTGGSEKTDANRTVNATLPPAPIQVPVDWEGSLGTNACAPSGPNSCLALFGGSGDQFHPTETDRVEAVDVTLHWNATTPLTEQLLLVVAEMSSCGEGCMKFENGIGVEGTSPLSLEETSPGFAQDATIGFAVFQSRLTPDPIYAEATVDQPFHLTGDVLHQPTR